MALEVEARFRATDAETLGRLAARDTLGVATLGEARTVLEIDRYLDTHDGRLAAARWACRLRSRDGVTRISLKGPPEGSAGGWLHRRPEVEGAASDEIDPAAWPPSSALALLTELSGRAPLLETLRLTQERTERSVAVDGRSVGTLTLDAVAAERAGTWLGDMHVVELEIRGDGVELDLAPLADELSREPGLSPEPRTKLELALVMAGTPS
jgi:inorganic triphosphatase YgiF